MVSLGLADYVFLIIFGVMTKEKAREILDNWVREKAFEGGFILPFVDQIVCKEISSDNTLSTELRAATTFTEWTFKGLIKLAYDL